MAASSSGAGLGEPSTNDADVKVGEERRVSAALATGSCPLQAASAAANHAWRVCTSKTGACSRSFSLVTCRPTALWLSMPCGSAIVSAVLRQEGGTTSLCLLHSSCCRPPACLPSLGLRQLHGPLHLERAPASLCAAPGYQLREYYINGKVDDCSSKWTAFMDCLKRKTTKYKDEVRQGRAGLGRAGWCRSAPVRTERACTTP